MNEYKKRQNEYKKRQKELADALRSGEYKQGFDQLRRVNDVYRYCCLGVACDVAARHGLGAWTTPEECEVQWEVSQFTAGEHASTGSMPAPVAEWYGFCSTDGKFAELVQVPHGDLRSLIDMNDTRQFTFDEIADKIENDPTLYVEEAR